MSDVRKKIDQLFQGAESARMNDVSYITVDELKNQIVDYIEKVVSEEKQLYMDNEKEWQKVFFDQQDKYKSVVEAAEEARSALDYLMGDSDMDGDESDEFVACQNLSMALSALKDQSGTKGTEEAGE